MVKLRSQEDDPVPQWFSRIQEAYDQRFSRIQEAYDQRFLRIQEATEQRFSRLEAMVADYCASMKQTNQTNQTGGSDHFERLRGDRRTEESPEDQALSDGELVETEVATELNGIEYRAVENEANTKMISAKVKEESIPQSKVSIPQSNSEILKSIEPGKVDLGLEKLEHVVMNEVDGDVERGQEAMSNTKICSAHQLFDQMPGRSSRANRVWKPGGLWYVRDHSGGSILMITQQFHGLQLQRIIYKDMKFQEVLMDDVLSVMVCWRMDETSSDLLLLNGKENEGWLNGSQALVLMKGITESSSRIEELLKEEPNFVKVNEVKMEKQKLRHVGDDVKKGKNSFLRVVKIILALAVKEYRMGKANERLLPGHYRLLHTFDQRGGLKDTLIAGTIMQSSLKLFHQLRVACLHHTSLGFLYGSLPRPPEENHSNFSNMLQYHETWSCSSLRTNRVWDPGG